MRNTTFIATAARTRIAAAIATAIVSLTALVGATGCDVGDMVGDVAGDLAGDVVETLTGGASCNMLGEAVAEAIARPEQFDAFATANLVDLSKEVAACAANPMLPVQLAAAAAKSCPGGDICEALDAAGVTLILESIVVVSKGDVDFLATAGGGLVAAGLDLPEGDLQSLVDTMSSAFMDVLGDLVDSVASAL